MNLGFADMMLVALIVDGAIGWPARLFAAVGHPVTWFGRLIALLDARWNISTYRADSRRFAGSVAVGAVAAAAAIPALAVQHLLADGWEAAVLGGLVAWPLVASRSLHDHVKAVAHPLAAGDMERAREAVAMIVGRNPAALDRAGIGRAALESLAENTSDGIVAPIFWGVVLGLPGIAAYKAVNTLDSMIGHRTPRHEAFGSAAARVDDMANLIPARLTGFMLAVVSKRPLESLRVMARDARRHRSPNAGWPEAAMAGALGVRLSGPRRYGERLTDEPWLNAGAPDPAPDMLAQGLSLYRRTIVLLAMLLVLSASI